MAPLAVSIAGAGVVVSALTATGMVVAFGGIIKDLSAGNLALLLVLLLRDGFGAWVSASPPHHLTSLRRIGVPQVLELGRPLGIDVLQAHLFVVLRR
jgi:TRAP-type uncharacterized transport system fused permease subunit